MTPEKIHSTGNGSIPKMNRGFIEEVSDRQASRRISDVTTLKALIRNAFFMLLTIIGVAALLGLFMPVNY